MSSRDQIPIKGAAQSTALATARHRPPEFKPAAAEGETLGQTLSRFRRVLRGRYLLIICLGLCGAVLGGLAGRRFAPLVYRSEGLVRIAYAMPQVFQETDQNRPMARFDSFLQSQKLLITSRRLIDLAVKDPAWRATGKGASPEVLADYARSLDVVVNSGNEYIRIAFADRDPNIASAGARAMVSAYSAVYNGQDEEVEDQVLHVAQDRSKLLEKQQKEIDSKIEGIAAEYGTTNLDSLHESAVQRVAKLQLALADVQLAITKAPKTTDGVSPRELVEQTGGNDGILRKYFDDLGTKETQLEVLKSRYGANHPRLQDAKNELAVAQRQFDSYIKGLGTAAAGAPANPATSLKSRSMLLTEESEVKALLNDAKNQMVAIGQRRATIGQLSKTREEIREELVKVNRRVELLQSEAALGGRLSVVSPGEVPVTPFKDYRLHATAAGVVAFGLFPAAMVLLVGMYRGRYRFSEDAHVAIGSRVPLLGILPRLRQARIEQDALAAQSVHQIRVLLQATDFGQNSRVFMLTSAAPGEGKTSLTLSLALSFAASHERTLVIDCDLTARRLTQSLNGTNVPGLPEALAAGHVNGYVQDFGGLSILTAGAATSLDASTLGSSYMRRLIASARKEYDVVLIDTGPVLGSVEAALAAREVDGALLVISAGQTQTLVGRALDQLGSLHTNVVGAVFNQAEPKDFDRSIYASSYSDALKRERERGTADAPILTCPFGPLVRAVLASLSRTSQFVLQ